MNTELAIEMFTGLSLRSVQFVLQLRTAVRIWKGTLGRAILLPRGCGPAVRQMNPDRDHGSAGLAVYLPRLRGRLVGMEVSSSSTEQVFTHTRLLIKQSLRHCAN